MAECVAMSGLPQLRWSFVLYVVPLPLWIPIAGLLIIGTQAAKSAEDARIVLIAVAAITLLLLVLAVFGVSHFGHRENYGANQWAVVGVVGAVLLIPVFFIVYIGFRALFWVT